MKTDNLPIYSPKEVLSAINELKKHGQINDSNNNRIFEAALGANYSGNYYRKSIKRSYLKECRFINANFDRAAATGSKFLNSMFINCKLSGANFQFCDFTGSSFLAENEDNKVEGSNFSESNFSNVNLTGLKIAACSFSRALFKDALINSCEIKSTTFESTIFIETKFQNMNLRNLNIDYADFINVKMENIVLPFSQLPYTFGGLTYLLQTNDKIWISSKINEGEKITIEEYKSTFGNLEKYYISIDEFFPLANIYLAKGEYDYAYQAIVSGLLYSIQMKDFRMLKFFCRLAARSDRFSRLQLQKLYDRIHEFTPLNKLNVSDLHNYEIHIGEIRSLLLNSEGIKLTAQINLKTNIESVQYDKLAFLVYCLNEVIKAVDPKLKWNYIEIRHNSPYELLLSISNSDVTILISAIVFTYTILMKSNKLYQEFCNSVLKRLEVKKKKIEDIKFSKLEQDLKKRDIKISDARHYISGFNYYSNSSFDNSLIHFHLNE